jgi:hypothetical protein
MTSDEAQQEQDLVLVMFLASTHPATVLFNSRASHSFIIARFVAKHNLPIANMKHTMLVRSPRGEMRTKLICPAISISLEVKHTMLVSSPRCKTDSDDDSTSDNGAGDDGSDGGRGDDDGDIGAVPPIKRR